jgi:S-adenosylmethionine-diacylglycerol 3-amino-3-carboxypropyl transferase
MPPVNATVKQVLGGLQDKAMYSLLGKEIVYNVSWEDPRVDCELLDLGPTDTVMMLASGGCNVLDMVLESPKKVVAVDLNPRQTALLELKMVCAQQLDHEAFFQIFALSNYDAFVKAYEQGGVRERLGDFARAYWDGNKDFFRNLHWSGASGFAAKWLVRLIRLVGLGGLLDGACFPSILLAGFGQRRATRAGLP